MASKTGKRVSKRSGRSAGKNPGAGVFIMDAFEVFVNNLKKTYLLCLASILPIIQYFSIDTKALGQKTAAFWLWIVVGAILSFLFSILIQIMLFRIYDRDGKESMAEVLSYAVSRYAPVTGVSLQVTGIMAATWVPAVAVLFFGSKIAAALLIFFTLIAFFYLAVNLIFTMPIVSLEPRVNEPITASIKRTKGRFWTIFLAVVAIALINTVLRYVLGPVGQLVSKMYTNMTEFGGTMFTYLLYGPFYAAFHASLIFVMYKNFKAKQAGIK